MNNFAIIHLNYWFLIIYGYSGFKNLFDLGINRVYSISPARPIRWYGNGQKTAVNSVSGRFGQYPDYPVSTNQNTPTTKTLDTLYYI